MTERRIEVGDLFYKRRGRFITVHLFLSHRPNSSKQHFVRLSAANRSLDSTHNRTHAALAKNGYTFAGNVLTRSSPEERPDVVGLTPNYVYHQWEYEARRYLDSAL